MLQESPGFDSLKETWGLVMMVMVLPQAISGVKRTTGMKQGIKMDGNG